MQFYQIKYFLHNIFLRQLKGKSQADKILWYLENHGRITNKQCSSMFGIQHTPGAIRTLRKRFEKQGSEYEIKNETKNGLNIFGEKSHWDEYVLVKKAGNVLTQACGAFETAYKEEIQINQ